MQAFVRLGREIRVNSNAAGDQRDPDIFATSFGGYQINWTDSTTDVSGSGIRAQVFSSSQSRFASEFTVNASGAGDQSDASSVRLASGWNVIVWSDASGSGDSSGTGIKAQFIDGAAGKFQGEYLINTTIAGNQYDPALAQLGLNNHVIVWTDESGGTPAIRAQLMASRNKSGTEILVSSPGGAAATDAVVTPLAGGAFVVVWRSADSAGSAIHAQLFATGGAKTGGIVTLAAGAAGAIANPAIATLADGRFVVAWTTVDGAGDAGIKAQVYSASGAPSGALIEVTADAAGAQTDPSIAALPGGGFVIGWTQGAVGSRDVLARPYSADGIPTGDAALVAESVEGDQWDLALATLTGGETILSWTEAGSDGNANVKAQLVQFASSAPIEGTAEDDTITGTVNADFIDGMGGADTLRGADGNDVLRGGEGADDLQGEGGNDIVEGGGGNDRLQDTTPGRDRLDGGDGNDVLVGMRSNIPTYRDSLVMIGGAGNDVIQFQGSGTDLTIDAGDGDDRLELSLREDVNANVVLGEGRDTIAFFPPESGVFRTPQLIITDFATGAGGDFVDLSGIANRDAFYKGEMQFRQAGADAVLWIADEYGRMSSYATFQNRLVSDFTYDNIGGVDLPATTVITGDAENSQTLFGNPAIRITGADTTFVNLSGGNLRGSDSSAAGLGALTIEAAGVVVDNRTGGLIGKSNAGGTLAITGSEHADTVINSGVIDGIVRLGAGDDLYSELVTTANNQSGRTPLEMGAGNDTARFDMNGNTTLNGADMAGGEGSDTIEVVNITGALTLRLGSTTGAETLRLTGAEPASVTVQGKPFIDHIYLSTHLTFYVDDHPFNSSVYIGPASGTVHLEGGALVFGPNASFGSILGSDAGEVVILSPRLFTPKTSSTPVGSIDLGGGDDYLVWHTAHPSPGSATGGAGDDRLRVGTDRAERSLAAFTSFETVNLFLANGYAGQTHRLTDIGADVERLLIDVHPYTGIIELDRISGTGLTIGAGMGKTILTAGDTVASISDRYLVDDLEPAGVAQNLLVLGTVTGAVTLGDGNDRLENGGTIQGPVSLGAGSDVYAGAAALAPVSVEGGGDNDTLTGGAGADLLSGDAGDDQLNGGAGADEMRGGAGDDIFHVDNAGDLVVEAAGEGTDTVIAAVDHALHDNVENLALAAGAGHISGTGNALGNVINGNEGYNALSGGGGNDRLDGREGGDEMSGGAGNDSYFVDHAHDSVIEAAGEGIDTVNASIAYVLPSHVETLVLTGTADILGFGNALANTIIGNSGVNALRGEGGDDILFGGGGADNLIGGHGNDVYRVTGSNVHVSEFASQGTDRVESEIDYILGDHLENLTLTGAGATYGAGNGLNNVIIGNGAANALTGNAGDDTLDGRAGADTLTGGLGNDVYVVDQAGDLVSELAGEGVDTVQSEVAWTLGDNFEILTLTGTGAIDGTGNALNNVLNGNAGANVLNGGAGADNMFGGMGNDTYIVADIGDKATETSTLGGDDHVMAAISFQLGSNIERLTLTGTGNLNGFGNAIANIIAGNSGNNTLSGGAGADTMTGGAGHDIYYVDNAGDVVTENASEGTDTVHSSIAWALGANLENLTLSGNAALSGTGNGLNNVITGNNGANMLSGEAGNDTLVGGLGADTLNGGAGDDIYVIDGLDTLVEGAGGGNDTVQTGQSYTLLAEFEYLVLTGSLNVNGTGNALNNVLTGNSGNNVLDGAAGADNMFGGMGNDTYVVDNVLDRASETSAGGGTDTVISSVSFTLSANVENLILTGSGNLTGIGNAQANVIQGNGGANVLVGGLGADTLDGGGGSDVFVYRSAADSTAAARDMILNFVSGDRIDLSQIDAVTATAGTNDAFAFIGAAAFSNTAGELRAYQSGAEWIVESDTDGDGNADLVIGVTTAEPAILAADFVL